MHSFSFYLIDKAVFPLKHTGKAVWQYGADEAQSPAGLVMDFNDHIQSSQWESNPEPSCYEANGCITTDVLEIFLFTVLISHPWRSHPSHTPCNKNTPKEAFQTLAYLTETDWSAE